MVMYPKILPQPIAHTADKVDIPLVAESGNFSYSQGFPAITQAPLAAGGVAPRRVDFNGIFNELSQHTFYQQSGGMYAWSAHLDYPLNALVYGSNNAIYKCIKANGVNHSNGVKNPISNTNFWKNLEEFEIPKNPLLYPTAFVSLYEQSPPAGFMVRNGALISNASNTVPLLYSALKEANNAWKLKTEAAWQAMRTSSPWNGVGGVPYFVLNESTNTIRLPDTRGMYEEGEGFDGLTVGGVHSDMMRNITGNVGLMEAQTGIFSPAGAFSYTPIAQNSTWVESSTSSASIGYATLNLQGKYPVGNANKPRAFGMLHCVYTG